jgi:hypothetical protein
MSDITPGDHEVTGVAVVVPPKNPLLSDAWYTRLEYLGRIVLPAFATLYLALSSLWKFPAGPEVVGTIVAVDTFLGLFLGYASAQYDKSEVKFDGSLDVTQAPDGLKTFSLNLNGEPESLMDKSQVVFKVLPPTV